MKQVISHRLALSLLALAALVVLAGLSPARDAIAYVIDRAAPVVAAYPVAGALAFIALAIASATMAFVSSLALVPIAVTVWGPAMAALFLWTGWFIGGNLTYTIGRHFGRPVVRRLVDPAKLRRYEDRVSRHTPFLKALAVMLAMPSDVAGYLFGTLGYPRRRFVAAVALAEVPYALLAAYLGDAAVRQRPWVLLILIPAAVLVARTVLRRDTSVKESPT